MTPPLLEVDGLHVEFVSGGVWVPAVENVSFMVDAGETQALVGDGLRDALGRERVAGKA